MPQNSCAGRSRPRRNFSELLDGGVSYPTLYRTHSDGSREAVPLQIDYVASNNSYALTPMATARGGRRAAARSAGAHVRRRQGAGGHVSGLRSAADPSGTRYARLVLSEGLLTVADARRLLQGRGRSGVGGSRADTRDAVRAFADVISYQLIVDGAPSAFLDSFLGATALPRATSVSTRRASPMST
jgi:hypothetical protein